MGVIHGVIKPVLPVTDGLWGWWDAARGVTKDGADNVEKWDDVSGNGHHWYQNIGADQPLFMTSAGGGDLNNLPVIAFPDGGAAPDWFSGATSFYEYGSQYDSTLFAVYTDLDSAASSWGKFFWSQFDRGASGEYPAVSPEFAQFSAQRVATGPAKWTTCVFGVSYDGNAYTGSNSLIPNDDYPHIIGQTCHDEWSVGAITFGPTIDITSAAEVETCYPTLCQGFGGSNTGSVDNFFYLNSGQFGTGPTYGMEYKLAELILYNKDLSYADFHIIVNHLNDKYNVYNP